MREARAVNEQKVLVKRDSVQLIADLTPSSL